MSTHTTVSARAFARDCTMHFTIATVLFTLLLGYFVALTGIRDEPESTVRGVALGMGICGLFLGVWASIAFAYMAYQLRKIPRIKIPDASEESAGYDMREVGEFGGHSMTIRQ